MDSLGLVYPLGTVFYLISACRLIEVLGWFVNYECQLFVDFDDLIFSHLQFFFLVLSLHETSKNGRNYFIFRFSEISRISFQP